LYEFVFQRKSRLIDLGIYFPNYLGGLNSKEAEAFIREMYLKRLVGRKVYVHSVTAIDTNNVERVWNSTREIILEANLQKCGIDT
jgi:hypothetical protein